VNNKIKLIDPDDPTNDYIIFALIEDENGVGVTSLDEEIEAIYIQNHLFPSVLQYSDSALVNGFQWSEDRNSNDYDYTVTFEVTNEDITVSGPSGAVFNNCLEITVTYDFPNGYDQIPYETHSLWYYIKGRGLVHKKRTLSDSTTDSLSILGSSTEEERIAISGTWTATADADYIMANAGTNVNLILNSDNTFSYRGTSTFPTGSGDITKTDVDLFTGIYGVIDDTVILHYEYIASCDDSGNIFYFPNDINIIPTVVLDSAGILQDSTNMSFRLPNTGANQVEKTFTKN